MTALLLSMMLAHAAVAAPEVAPSSAPAEATSEHAEEAHQPAPPAATPVVTQPAAPPQPLWRTLPEHPLFVRVFSAAVLGAGTTIALLGVLGLGTLLGARFTPALNRLSEDTRNNTVAVCTLAAATGLVLGGVLMAGGIAGLFLP